MSIKSVAHLAQQSITSDSGPSFKRTHCYELIAAAFGFGSYAALGSESVLFSGAAPPTPKRAALRIAAVTDRCRELGYPASASDVIAQRLCSILAAQALDAIRLTDLIRSLRPETHPDDTWGDEDETAGDSNEERRYPWENAGPGERDADTDAILRESLEAAADRHCADAHYALALLHGFDQYAEHESESRPYWYEHRQAGVVLEGAQAEWADTYEREIAARRAFETHLREATRLGHPDAAVDLGRYFNDPAVFDTNLDLSDQDPRDLAELAASLNRPAEASRWLTVAAVSGDTGAMRELIEGHDAGDLPRCWMWLHLAALHGVDLTKDDYHAVNEDGGEYDDDAGGPIYADGVDGIQLEPLSPEADALARRQAVAIHTRERSSPHR